MEAKLSDGSNVDSEIAMTTKSKSQKAKQPMLTTI